MLKKLVKYGNSNAIVLDKALLELLNIEEGSVVKLRTDGTSLIITAQHKVSQEKVAQTVIPQDTLQEAVKKTLMQNYDADAYLNELREVPMRYPDEFIAFKKIHEKYRHVQEQVIKLNENPEYIHESVLLAEKYEATKNSPEYIQEQTNLITKHIPEYAVYQDEIKAVGESLNKEA